MIDTHSGSFSYLFYNTYFDSGDGVIYFTYFDFGMTQLNILNERLEHIYC